MDIHSMEAMEDTILSFTGAVVLVTHDRYLLGRVADSLLRIHDDQAEFKEGTYEDNQAWVDLDVGVEPEEQQPEAPEETPRKAAGKPQGGPPAKPQAKQAGSPARPQAIDRDQQKTVKRWERKVKEAETEVARLEKKLAAIGAELAVQDPGDWQAFSAKLDAQKSMETDLAYAMTEWEEAQTALEEAQG
jgi:hypothetical protein